MNTRRRIVVAEDELIWRVSINDFLVDQECDVSLATSAGELVALANSVFGAGGPGPVLIVDVRLPSIQMEGIEAVGQLRASMPAGTKCIFISVLSEDDCRSKLAACGIQAGSYVWLQKPFDFDILLQRIQS